MDARTEFFASRTVVREFARIRRKGLVFYFSSQKAAEMPKFARNQGVTSLKAGTSSAERRTLEGEDFLTAESAWS
jgi:hypothetical protein